MNVGFHNKYYNPEKWLHVILAVAVLEYIRLLYIDVTKIVLSGQGYPYGLISLLSYIDLLYLPFVFYMFYKRMRWGWIMLFGLKLLTIEPSLLFYFEEYWPTESGIGLFPYFLIAIFLLDIPILIFLWRQDVCSIFKVNNRTRWITVLAIVLVLALLTVVRQYLHTNYAQLKSNTENQITSAGKPADTTTAPPPALLATIKATNEKPVDTTYMATGFYFLAEKGKGINMRVAKATEIYTIARLPFASVENITQTKLETTHLKDGDYTELCMTFDSKGTEDLAKGTGNPLHPKIAVVVANRLMYVVENKTSFKTGVMCVGFADYSENEMEAIRHSVDMKR